MSLARVTARICLVEPEEKVATFMEVVMVGNNLDRLMWYRICFFLAITRPLMRVVVAVAVLTTCSLKATRHTRHGNS
jgi:hypothetical protein